LRDNINSSNLQTALTIPSSSNKKTACLSHAIDIKYKGKDARHEEYDIGIGNGTLVSCVFCLSEQTNFFHRNTSFLLWEARKNNLWLIILAHLFS